VTLALCSLPWVRLNIEPSVPLGFYLLHPVHPPLTRGTLVLLPVPLRVLPWKSPWIALLKPVAAVPGDQVCRRENMLVIRGVDYGVVYTHAGGMTLPQALDEASCLVVQEGEVFLASAAEQSLDSRYFAAVKVTDITAVATPLWTWR
jgi:type IV secretory pathway protease TraF